MVTKTGTTATKTPTRTTRRPATTLCWSSCLWSACPLSWRSCWWFLFYCCVGEAAGIWNTKKVGHVAPAILLSACSLSACSSAIFAIPWKCFTVVVPWICPPWLQSNARQTWWQHIFLSSSLLVTPRISTPSPIFESFLKVVSEIFRALWNSLRRKHGYHGEVKQQVMPLTK